VGPALAASIAACAGRILGFHVSDWRLETRDTVFDRGMMGDGVIDLRGIPAWSKRGYHGLIEVESCRGSTGATRSGCGAAHGAAAFCIAV